MHLLGVDVPLLRSRSPVRVLAHARAVAEQNPRWFSKDDMRSELFALFIPRSLEDDTVYGPSSPWRFLTRSNLFL